MKNLIVILVLLSLNGYCVDSTQLKILKDNDIQLFKKVESLHDSTINISNEVRDIKTNFENKKQEKIIAIWALIISLLNMILIAFIRWYHVKTLKRIQTNTENFNWKQLITKLIGDIIAELEFPSGENLHIRLKTSSTFGKNINQLREILELKFSDQGDKFGFLTNWSSHIVDSNQFKSKMKEISQIIQK